MGATIFNKKDFLDYLDKNINSDEVIMITDMIKSVNYFKNKGTKEITAEFPSFAFKSKELSDILDSKKVGVLILDRKHLIKDVLDVADGKSKEARI